MVWLRFGRSSIYSGASEAAVHLGIVHLLDVSLFPSRVKTRNDQVNADVMHESMVHGAHVKNEWDEARHDNRGSLSYPVRHGRICKIQRFSATGAIVDTLRTEHFVDRETCKEQ